MTPALRWTIAFSGQRRRAAWVLTAAGRISAANAGALVDALNAALAAGQRHIVLDLAGVDYVSSAALTTLDAMSGRAIISGATLVLCGISGPVRTAFEFAGLLDQFEIASDIDDAVARLDAHG